MKVLFIVTAFNGLSQRAWTELDRLNHQVKVHIATSDKKMIRAVQEYCPDLIVAPYLKKAIPEAIWKNFTCFIVHPGIAGDRGSCSLDWAILNEEKEWGVTIIQATEKMDAGPVWSTAGFPMRTLSKSFLYRHEVTNAAMQALLEAIKRFEEKNFQPKTADEIDSVVKGKWNRSTAQSDFAFSWNDDTASILRKINAADGFPGAICRISDECYFAYGACEEEILKGKPGKILAQRNHALCIATGDTSIWIQCLKKNIEGAIKLPAAIAIGNADQIAEATIGVFENIGTKTFREIQYEEMNEVGCLHFDFYNGAMSADQCKRLLEAFQEAKRRNTRVIVLMGGKDIWSNGIHLNMIEASDNPAQASWENIQAIDDLVREIACTETQYVISALQGNAGGGGVALALAADKVMARKGIVFNPHTRSMGLYGSEYWTYLLPRRIGTQRATQFTEQCLPWGTDLALEVKLIDECIEDDGEIFQHKIKKIAEEIASLSYFNQLLGAKKFKRNRDERYKPLENYRKEELEKMHRNFFDDDMNYNYKRYCFIHKINPEEETGSVVSRDLFSERRKIWRRRKSEQLFYEAS